MDQQQALEAWGGGLDSVVPAREKPPRNIAQPYAEEARAAAAQQQWASPPHGSPSHSGHVQGTNWDGVGEPPPRRAADHCQNSWRGGDPRDDDPRRDSYERDYDDLPLHQQQRGHFRPPERDFEDEAPMHQMMNDIDDLAVSERSATRRNDGGAARVMQDRDQPIRMDRKAPEGCNEEAPRDFMRGPPSHNRSNRDLSMDGSGGDCSGPPASPQQPPTAPEPRQPPRSRQRALPPVDDGWAGQGLGDALAPKKAPVSTASSTAGGASRSGIGGASTAGSDCSKTPQEIVKWVRSLPESHVPEKAREQVVAIVEDRNMGGSQFSQYVQAVPPEVCGPKHAMKLKAAWGNVLKEAAAREVAISNLNSAPKQKATMIVV